MIILAVPAFLVAISAGHVDKGKWLALIIVTIILAVLLFVFYSVTHSGIVYRMILRISPAAEVFINDLKNNKIN